MQKVVGFETYSFTPKESDQLVEGYNIYTTELVQDGKGKGFKTEKLSFTKSKYANTLSITPDQLIGKEVQVFYNKYKKPEHLVLEK